MRKLWCFVFRFRVHGKTKEVGLHLGCFQAYGKTKEVHGTMFSGSNFRVRGKLWKYMVLFFQVQNFGVHG